MVQDCEVCCNPWQVTIIRDRYGDLNDDEAIAEHMTAVLETNDPDLLLLALSDVARAQGIDADLGPQQIINIYSDTFVRRSYGDRMGLHYFGLSKSC